MGAGNSPHSRASSRNSVLSNSSQTSATSTPQNHSHAPQTPSRLRQSHAPGSSPSAEPHIHQYTSLSSSPPPGNSPVRDSPLRSSSPPLDIESNGIHPDLPNDSGNAESLEQTRVRGHIVEDHSRTAADENARLLENYHKKHANCGGSPCSHGTFSPRAESLQERDDGSFGGRYQGEDEQDGERGDTAHRLFGDAVADGLLGGRSTGPKIRRWDTWIGRRNTTNGKGVSTTRWLAETYGIKGKRRMYISYYIPFLNCESFIRYC